MDVEATLTELRTLAAELVENADETPVGHDAARMAELFTALDAVITRDGRLPGAWYAGFRAMIAGTR